MDQKPSLTYDAVQEGQTLGPITYRVEPDLIRAHLDALGFETPSFLVDPESGALLVEPVMLVRNHIRLVRKHFTAHGMLHARTQVSMQRAVRAGETVTVTGRVAEKYERRGRQWLVIEATMVDEQGRVISNARDTLAFPR